MLAGALALALVGAVAAQESDQPVPPDQGDQTQTVDQPQTMDQSPAVDDTSVPVPVPAPMLFVRVIDPVEEDVEVPLETTSITISGMTLPGAIVSVDGMLVDVDDQGVFTWSVALDEGANSIDVIASTPDGAEADAELFVTRGA
jgi:FtsP/CotA-like multicopper oxidase with cupredoxin domain